MDNTADGLVALTRGILKAGPAQHLYHATGVFDEPCPLKRPGGYGNAGPAAAQHLREQIMGYRKRLSFGTVVAQQKPASQSLFNLMQTIARRHLGYLHALKQQETV